MFGVKALEQEVRDVRKDNRKLREKLRQVVGVLLETGVLKFERVERGFGLREDVLRPGIDLNEILEGYTEIAETLVEFEGQVPDQVQFQVGDMLVSHEEYMTAFCRVTKIILTESGRMMYGIEPMEGMGAQVKVAEGYIDQEDADRWERFEEVAIELSS